MREVRRKENTSKGLLTPPKVRSTRAENLKGGGGRAEKGADHHEGGELGAKHIFHGHG